MRSDVPSPAAGGVAKLAAVVTLYKTGTFQELIAETITGGVNLSSYAESVSHSSSEATIRFRHHDQLDDVANKPEPGNLITLSINGSVLFAGLVAQVRRAESVGVRSITVTLRSRGSYPAWREARRVTAQYPIGTSIRGIAADIIETVGLVITEYDLPAISTNTVHDQVQLADQSAWSMLETILQSQLLEPFIDAIGRFKTISRSVIGRTADIAVSASHQVSVEWGSVEVSPVTQVMVRWLSSEEVKVYQGERMLRTINITGGALFFSDDMDITWSEGSNSGDQPMMRADFTRLIPRKSINLAAFNPFAFAYGQDPLTFSESFAQTTPYGGTLSLRASGIGHAMMVGGAVTYLALTQIELPVLTGGVGATVGAAIRKGIVVGEDLVLMAVLAIASQIGNGIYEILGNPYDVVFPVHEVLCYDDAADGLSDRSVEIRNDFLTSRADAEAVGINELLYLNRSSASSNVTIQDDWRVEPGDVLELPGGALFYVTDYERELSRPSPGTLTVQGFLL